ncbi:sensor histidine kinase [Luteitalea pratensis]|nr:HAMP domain-containing sensor histidine kinase [Luteitalea pratensis]
MTVRRKLITSVAALLLLSGASTILSVRARQRTTWALADVQAGQVRLQRLLSIERELQLRWRELSVLREVSPSAAQLDVMDTRLDALDAMVRDATTSAEERPFSSAYAALSAAWRGTLDALHARRALDDVASPAAALGALLAWRDAEQGAAAADAARFAEALDAADFVTMALLGLSFVVGTTIVVTLSVTLTSGFTRLDAASRHVAAGDYSFRLPLGRARDEFARAARTFNDMAGALEAAVAETQEARRRAEDASAAKSSFLTSLCHDLKTPLTAILGYADVIEADVEHAGLAVSTGDVRQLRRSARVLLGMVGELLDYARLEAGRMPVALGAMDPAELVTEVVDTLQPMLEQRGNAFVLTDRWHGTLTTDPGKVRHILLNLLGNACKFTSQGTIGVVIGARPDGPGIVLEVSDTGIGMSREEAATVFAPYVQANSDIVHRFGGSGLGLSISKQFAQLLDGDITVASTEGIGTTFVLSLPDLEPAADSIAACTDLDEAVALFAALDGRERQTRLSA